MASEHVAAFVAGPQPTVFIVNVIHAHPGKQEEAFAAIQDVVHYVARTKQGFLWSNLSKSTDGKTVVNIEAISGENKVDEFFPIPSSWRNSAGWMGCPPASSIPTAWMTWCCQGEIARASVCLRVRGGGQGGRPGLGVICGLPRRAEMRWSGPRIPTPSRQPTTRVNVKLIGMLDSLRSAHRHLAAPARHRFRSPAAIRIQHLRRIQGHQSGRQGAHAGAGRWHGTDGFHAHHRLRRTCQRTHAHAGFPGAAAPGHGRHRAGIGGLRAVQIVYERNLRPTEKQHEPWVTRAGPVGRGLRDA